MFIKMEFCSTTSDIIHREWISPASVSFILHKLVEEGHLYSDILNTFTFYISPRCRDATSF